MFNWFKRSEKPIEQKVETPAVPKYTKTVFEDNGFAEYSDEMKKIFYFEAATIEQQEAFEVIATNLIRKYGYEIIAELSNTPIQTTPAELNRQKILAIEEFVEEVGKAASRLRKEEGEKEKPIAESEYFKNLSNNQ